MSITGINGTSAITRIAAPVGNPAAVSGSTRASAAPAAPTLTAPSEVKQQDEAGARSTSVHFPWLSRLSAKLEAASKQRARFPTQIMGDHVDRKA